MSKKSMKPNPIFKSWLKYEFKTWRIAIALVPNVVEKPVINQRFISSFLPVPCPPHSKNESIPRILHLPADLKIELA